MGPRWSHNQLEAKKHACEGLLETLRMFGMGHFCAHQMLNVMFARHISVGCVDNTRQRFSIALIRLSIFVDKQHGLADNKKPSKCLTKILE